MSKYVNSPGKKWKTHYECKARPPKLVCVTKTCLRGSKSLRLLISIDTHVDEELMISET